MKIKFYEKSSGRIPVLDFIETLSKRDQATVLAILKSVEELGFQANRAQFRQLRGKLWEIKCRLSSGAYRIFYVSIDSSVIVLLHVYKKQSQKAPLREIETAERRMTEVLENVKFYK